MTQELNERVIPFGEAVDTLRKFIHDPAGDVQTESGPMPNLRKINDELRQSGAVATVTEGVKTVQVGLEQVHQAIANAQAAGRTLAHWPDLETLTPSIVGEGAEVMDSDTGEHYDPNTGALVPNAGKYTGYAQIPGAWTRIGGTGLSSKPDKTVTGTNSRVYDDGRFARSGFQAAVALANRRPLWSYSGSEIRYHAPIRADIAGLDEKLSHATGGVTYLTDGRFARCGYSAAYLDQHRRLVLNLSSQFASQDYVDGVAAGLASQMGGIKYLTSGRFARCGYDGAVLDQNRRLLLDYSSQPASQAYVDAAATELQQQIEDVADQVSASSLSVIPWSDGTNIFVDHAQSGKTLRVSPAGSGHNTNPRYTGGKVIYSSDRAGSGIYVPAARGGLYYSEPDRVAEHPVIALPVMACFGDSTTAQGWSSKLAGHGWNIRALNFGRSSNTALGIASRAWAVETSYQCPVIPADGSEVECAASSTSVGKPMQSWADASASINGWLVNSASDHPSSGIFVTVRWDTDLKKYFIKRFAAGSALAAGKWFFYAAPTPNGDGAKTPDLDQVWNFGDMMLALLIGRNNYTNPQAIFDNTRRIVDAWKPISKRMILMPFLNGIGEGIGTVAYGYRQTTLEMFQAEWPDNTLDLLPYLIAGASSSAEDQAAVAANYPPPSLMTDNVHPNDAGRVLMAQGVYDFSLSKGWVSQ